MNSDPIFVWTSPGKPTLTRDLASTDTYLRKAFGDNANTTATLMSLASGKLPSLQFAYNGVVLKVRRF